MMNIKLNKNLRTELLVLDRNTWNHLVCCKPMNSDSFKNNVTNKLFDYKSYNIYIYV